MRRNYPAHPCVPPAQLPEVPILQRLFPSEFSARYEGSKAALWILGVLLVFKFLMAFNSTFLARWVAVHADALPLDRYSALGADTVVTMSALWGVTQLCLVAFAVVCLLRYRALVPLLFLFFIAETIGRRLVLTSMPIERSTPASSLLTLWFLPALMLCGFALSMASSRRRNASI